MLDTLTLAPPPAPQIAIFPASTSAADSEPVSEQSSGGQPKPRPQRGLDASAPVPGPAVVRSHKAQLQQAAALSAESWAFVLETMANHPPRGLAIVSAYNRLLHTLSMVSEGLNVSCPAPCPASRLS